jgi:hypothetical protein
MESAYIERPQFSRSTPNGDVTLVITVSDAIHKTLQGAARSRGITLTLWARSVLLRAANETPRDSRSFGSLN